MKRVLTAAVLIPLVILALFKAPLWLFTLLVFAVAMLAAHEYFGILKAQGYKPFEGLCFTFLAMLFLVAYWQYMRPFARPLLFPRAAYVLVAMIVESKFLIFSVLAPLILLLAGLRRNPLSRVLPDTAVSYLLLPYIGFTLALLPALRVTYGPLFVLFLMLLVWCGDIAAYYVGRVIGRHKLAPRISPGKSWEGAIASVLGAVVVGLLLFFFITPIVAALRAIHLVAPPNFDAQPVTTLAPIWMVVLFAVAVNVSAQLGDLVESALKRGASLKDSGTILPGHGGVLDRIDALLFALPVGMIFYFAGMSRYFAAI